MKTEVFFGTFSDRAGSVRHSVRRCRWSVGVISLFLCVIALRSDAQDKNVDVDVDVSTDSPGPAVAEETRATTIRAVQASALPPGVHQLLVGVAENWNSSRGKLWRFERKPSSESTSDNSAQTGGDRQNSGTLATTNKKSSIPWTRLTRDEGVDILLGRNGLAWGRGALTIPRSLLDRHAATKREGDRRAPAGCFAIPRIFGDDAALPGNASFPYRQVSRWDAWPDDPNNPFYNRHVIIDPAQGVPDWFEKQRMRQGDPAYRWLIEVRHNADPPQAGAGSAIFFHIRRGPDRTTAGCTTMSEGNLAAVVQWLKIDARPHYVLLPRAEYRILAPIWDLPALP